MEVDNVKLLGKRRSKASRVEPRICRRWRTCLGSWRIDKTLEELKKTYVVQPRTMFHLNSFPRLLYGIILGYATVIS